MASPRASQSSTARSSKKSLQLSTWCRASIVCKTVKSEKNLRGFSVLPDAPNFGPQGTAIRIMAMEATVSFRPTPTLSARACRNLKSFLTSTRAHNLQPQLKNSDRPSTLRAWGEETMGRIYDALKRAESVQRQPKPSVSRNGNPDNVAYFVPKHVHPWERQPFTGMPAGIDSASTAHTEEATRRAGPPPRTAFPPCMANLWAL